MPDEREVGLLSEKPVPASGGRAPRASARAITMNVVTSGLGSAIFSLPWSLAGSSILPALLIMGLVLLANAWTISIVVRAAERYSVFDLGGVIGRLPGRLGKPLQAATNVFVWASMFLCLVSYVIVIHDSALKFVRGTWLESRLVLVALASLCVLPLCFLNQQWLEKTSSVAIAVNIYLFGLLGVLYCQAASDGDLPPGSCLLGSTVRGNFAMISVMFHAVVIQMCVLPMYAELENRSPQKFNKIVAVGFTILFVLFSGFSIAGYLLIGENVKSNILQDLPRSTGSSIAQVGVMLVVACVYPIMVYPMIAPLQACQGDLCGVPRGLALATAKCVIVAGAMLTALVVEELGTVNVVNGAVSAAMCVAILPSVIGLVLLESGACGKAALVSLLVGGLAVSVFGLYFDRNYVEDLRCLVPA
mmetsp:Transcript_108818/g.338049  ORF Transcript_108818/g.338049 Transcript_108818/m.338049 type:complete len:418 (-) Transcript_108818:68-1321(-)